MGRMALTGRSDLREWPRTPMPNPMVRQLLTAGTADGVRGPVHTPGGTAWCRLIASSFVVASALALVGCQGDPGAMRWPVGAGAFGAAEFSVPAYQSWTFGGLVLCVSRPGTATITAVVARPGTTVPLGGLHVEAFAVRPEQHLMFGAGAQTLSAIADGFVPDAPQQVTANCAAPGQEQTWPGGSELAVQVAKDVPGPAVGVGLDVTYTFDGATGTFTIPFVIQLCNLPQSERSGCPPDSTDGLPG